MLYDYIIIYDYKTEGKKERQQVHIGTNVHLFEYKLQRCFYKGNIVYIFHIVFCVCCVYSTWHTVIYTLIHYFILFCSIQSMFQELNKKSNSKETMY